MTSLLADLRYAVRVLRKSPGFTVVAIVALAIGIGANVTIFGIANTFVLRQLPIADPSSAVRVYRDRDSNSSYLDYVDFRGDPAVVGRTINLNAIGFTIIVNETAARRFWPGESAVGKRLREWLPGGQALGPPLEVIGVARDASYGRYGEPPLSFAYRPLAQNYSTNASLLVRTTAGGAGVAAADEREIHRIDADLPVLDVSPLSVATSISLLPARIAGTLFAVFGGLALVLASIGLYGVMSYFVRQRRREIAVRLALGAERSHVVAAVVFQGMRWAAVGLVGGGVAAVVLVRSAAALLPGVRAFDPLTLVIITGILAATAFAACGIPTRRASCVDPSAALRQD